MLVNQYLVDKDKNFPKIWIIYYKVKPNWNSL